MSFYNYCVALTERAKQESDEERLISNKIEEDKREERRAHNSRYNGCVNGEVYRDSFVMRVEKPKDSRHASWWFNTNTMYRSNNFGCLWSQLREFCRDDDQFDELPNMVELHVSHNEKKSYKKVDFLYEERFYNNGSHMRDDLFTGWMPVSQGFREFVKDNMKLTAKKGREFSLWFKVVPIQPTAY